MTHLYREFQLRHTQAWSSLVAFVKANARAMADAGTPLRLIVTTSETKRNAEQNKRYWGFVLKTIAATAWVDGRQFSADVWHEYFARKFGICEDVTLPGGEVISRRRSTTEMSVSEFGTYMNEVEAHAMSQLGVTFE
jgi:hypothetical protein